MNPQPWTSDRVRDLRTKLGYTQSEFAQLLGVAKTTVERWEAPDEKDGQPNPRRLPPNATYRLFLTAISWMPSEVVHRLKVVAARDVD